MISSELIKDIIKSNEEFILNAITRIVPRIDIIEPTKFASDNLRKVNILYGVRRSGKTFLLYDIFQENKESSLYIDFEDERLRDIELDDLDLIKESFFELKPNLIDAKKIFFLLDEVQNIDGWERFVRRITEREDITVYAAGSSSKITPKNIHTSLRGRAWGIEVFPFSFPEYLQIKGLDLKSSVYGKNKVLIKNALSDYLTWGGFPEVSLVDSEFEKKKILREYLDAMYFKDLVEKYEISNIPLLETLKENIFSSFSAKFSLTAFERKYRGSFPFSKDYLYSYYNNFIESMLVFETRLFTSSAYKRKRNPPKVYLVDTGLTRNVGTVDYGRLLENAVFLELKRKGGEIFYADQNGECDFVVKDKIGKIHAIQTTWELGEHNKEREIKGLVKTCEKLTIRNAEIITFNQEASYTKNNIKLNIVPFWKWLL
ncbi:MAG: ATP-binding protein [Candidatus Cloacimonetes bacterium]|nr:ATP-binding protein [Candidatus Cloacimonadota bacterium]